MFKEGDYLLCKKDLFYQKESLVKSTRIYRKGKFYEILLYSSVTEDFFVLTDEYEEDEHPEKGLWFVENLTNFPFTELYLAWEYFYTEKEMRKVKLDKLNELHYSK